MASRDICKRCINEFYDKAREKWQDVDDGDWESGAWVCPLFPAHYRTDGEIGTIVQQMIPTRCRYFMEQTLHGMVQDAE